MLNLKQLATALIVVSVFIMPARLMAAEDEPTTASITNTWTSNDWFAFGAVIPAPITSCESEEHGSECREISTMGIAARLELGRFRYDSFQFALGHIFMGMDWTMREHMGFGLAGVGQHFRLDESGHHELGYLVWPLSIFMDDAWGNVTTQVYYRHNDDESFIEAGIEFSPYWNDSPLGEGGSMKLRDFPFHLYVQTGLPTVRVNDFFEETAAWAEDLFTEKPAEAPTESAGRAEYLSLTAGWTPVSENLLMLRGELALAYSLSMAASYGLDMSASEGFERYEVSGQLNYYIHQAFQGFHLSANGGRGQTSHAERTLAGVGVGYKWVGPLSITLFGQARLSTSWETVRNDEGYWAAVAKRDDPDAGPSDDDENEETETSMEWHPAMLLGAGWSF